MRRSRGRRRLALIALAVFVPLVVVASIVTRPIWNPYWVSLTGGRSMEETVLGLADARDRMRSHVESAGLAYPPASMAFVAFKDERRLEVWGRDGTGDASGDAAGDGPGGWTFITDRPVLAASGGPGPKLREGDRQVPEGIHAIAGLNPNSAYHLSMKLDYPNADDLARAADDGRDDPGSNIFIHGRATSIGCLAMGDPVIEELFVLVHDVGADAVRVIIAPSDPRERALRPPEGAPAWTAQRYAEITAALQDVRGTDP